MKWLDSYRKLQEEEKELIKMLRKGFGLEENESATRTQTLVEYYAKEVDKIGGNK